MQDSLAILIDIWDNRRPAGPQRIKEKVAFAETVYSYCMLAEHITDVSVSTYNELGKIDNSLTYQSLLQLLQSAKPVHSFESAESIASFIAKKQISNVFIMGGLFDICCQFRPTGYNEIVGATPEHVDVLIHLDCMVFRSMFTKQMFIENPGNWEKITDKIYRYKR